MENIETILKKHKKKKFKYHHIITKFLLSIIFIFIVLIYTNNTDNLNKFKDKFLTNSLSFMTFNNWYTQYFGEIMPTVSSEEVVFSNNLSYLNITKDDYKEVLKLSSKSTVANIVGGVVVFIGEKENFGNTVIIQGNDGYDIWYGNLENININIYDYLDNETILGETVTDELYLKITKNNEIIDYETYKN